MCLPTAGHALGNLVLDRAWWWSILGVVFRSVKETSFLVWKYSLSALFPRGAKENRVFYT